MSNRLYLNPTYYHERCQPGQMAAYLLGLGLMPPPTQQEIQVAVAAANYLLDSPIPGPEPANVPNDNKDEKIDPQLRNLQLPQLNPPQGKFRRWMMC